MANILQVTQPAIPNDNRAALESQAAKGQAGNHQIQNPVDPSRVVRADGREDGKTGDATGQGTVIVDYESNYGAFLQKLNGSEGLTGLLGQLFFEDKAGYLLPDDGVLGALLEQVRSSLQMETPEQLLAFFKEQVSGQAKFSGDFFQNIRTLLTQNTSPNLKAALFSFLKGYNDVTSGKHQLQQLQSMTDTISNLMLSQSRDEFRGLVQQMDWAAANGDVAHNTEVLNNTLIPFLSNYVSRTHDYGAVRDAIMLFVLHAVKYENGSADSLEQLLERILSNKEFINLYEGEAREDLDQALQELTQKRSEGGLAKDISEILERGSRGEAGLEHVSQFYQVFQGFLLNESVYMPLLHFLVPFSWQGTEVTSEIWVDPDADREEENGSRKIKMMFKFHIQHLGNFDMALEFQDRKTDLQLYVPTSLQPKAEEIQTQIGSILKKNGIIPNRLLVREKKGELKVSEVFPEIREKEKSVNVRV